MTKKIVLKTREEWYQAAMVELAGLFRDALPKLRIGCGWPTRKRKVTAGQCFDKKGSGDATYEIFISPAFEAPVEILAFIVHEVGHAVVGCEHGHKAPYRIYMGQVGMEAPFTGCKPGPDLAEKLAKIAAGLPEYPHHCLVPTEKKGSVGSRLLKVMCPECGYIVRVTRKWLTEVGAPLCPTHKTPFVETKAESK